MPRNLNETDCKHNAENANVTRKRFFSMACVWACRGSKANVAQMSWCYCCFWL